MPETVKDQEARISCQAHYGGEIFGPGLIPILLRFQFFINIYQNLNLLACDHKGDSKISCKPKLTTN